MLIIAAPALDTFSSSESPVMSALAADLQAGSDDYTFTLGRALSDEEKEALDAAQCTVANRSLRCTSDRYDRDGDTYSDLADFLAMCDANGWTVDLTETAAGYSDEEGPVLEWI